MFGEYHVSAPLPNFGLVLFSKLLFDLDLLFEIVGQEKTLQVCNKHIHGTFNIIKNRCARFGAICLINFPPFPIKGPDLFDFGPKKL